MHSLCVPTCRGDILTVLQLHLLEIAYSYHSSRVANLYFGDDITNHFLGQMAKNVYLEVVKHLWSVGCQNVLVGGNTFRVKLVIALVCSTLKS